MRLLSGAVRVSPGTSVDGVGRPLDSRAGGTPYSVQASPAARQGRYTDVDGEGIESSGWGLRGAGPEPITARPPDGVTPLAAGLPPGGQNRSLLHWP